MAQLLELFAKLFCERSVWFWFWLVDSEMRMKIIKIGYRYANTMNMINTIRTDQEQKNDMIMR